MSNEFNLFDQDPHTRLSEPQKPPPTDPVIHSPGSLEASQLEQIFDKVSAKQETEAVEERLLKQCKKIIEALLFASSEPISFDKIRQVTDLVDPLKPRTLLRLIHELQEEYVTQERAFRLEESKEGFVLRSCEEYGPYIEELYRNRRGDKLTHAATEVLAIIAYRQPVTRPIIDSIRGVDSSGIIHTLIERNLIEVVGRLEAVGRPSLYSVTPKFMQHFGLRNLEELPPLKAKEEGTPGGKDDEPANQPSATPTAGD